MSNVLDALDATDRLVQGFVMANYLIWLYSAMAVLVPWRPVVKVMWRLCGGKARTRKRKQNEEYFLMRLLRRVDVALTSLLLAVSWHAG